MRQFNDELAAAGQGKHPDPGSLPAGFSDFPFALTLDRRAYDLASADYQEQYFYNQNVAAAFDTWLAGLPAGGQVLDAGCGHGDPVISRLLERGFQVTGCDLSPAMLGLARQKFPGVSFLECPITSLETRDAFDGVCSFSSMLYLDPIDFLHAIHRALRPGGLLFLFGCDAFPDTRGDPYGVDLKNWMWGGRRGIQETVQALEEHGYFQVLQAQETTIPEEREQVLERWRANAIRRHEELLKEYTPEANIPESNLDNPPQLPFGYVITARRLER